MNAKEQAQARFRQAVLDMRDVVRHGNQDVLGRHTDDALMFGDAYAAACVVEARAPLVEALRAALHALTTYQGLWASDECRDGGDYSFQLSDTALLDQITDILGPPTGQPEAGDATEMHGV